jgi:hypothetical protein
LDYVLENAVSISQIKAVENKLVECGLRIDLDYEQAPKTLGKRQRVD